MSSSRLDLASTGNLDFIFESLLSGKNIPTRKRDVLNG